MCTTQIAIILILSLKNVHPPEMALFKFNFLGEITIDGSELEWELECVIETYHGEILPRLTTLSTTIPSMHYISLNIILIFIIEERAPPILQLF
jgi:hypothetical protein